MGRDFAGAKFRPSLLIVVRSAPMRIMQIFLIHCASGMREIGARPEHAGTATIPKRSQKEQRGPNEMNTATRLPQ